VTLLPFSKKFLEACMAISLAVENIFPINGQNGC
jgi:hypothetical protein